MRSEDATGTDSTVLRDGFGAAFETWVGRDEFTTLDDRLDAQPLRLPSVASPKRVVLVRHGQSTWNAEGRIQGCTDAAVLTDKGRDQAATTRDVLKGEDFDVLITSPLARATQTADVIWKGGADKRRTLPSLREIDLYSFQGLMKNEGKAKFGAEYTKWQKSANLFEIDGHAPVRELWYRASLAWQEILNTAYEDSCILVVAHNAVNQALVATAIGLPCTYFRRLLQSNGATTVLDFQPALDDDDPPRVTLDRLNQAPGSPYEAGGRAAACRVVLIRHAATESSHQGLILGSNDEDCSIMGNIQATKTAEVLLDMKVSAILSSPMRRCTRTSQYLAEVQSLGKHAEPSIHVTSNLTNLNVGGWQGKPARTLRGTGLPVDSENLDDFWSRTTLAWQEIKAAAAADDGSVVVVSHAAVLSALSCQCLDLDKSAMSLFRFETGGVSIIDFPDGSAQPGVVRCLNYTAHLGRWAVPITRDDLETVCGIDGCF